MSAFEKNLKCEDIAPVLVFYVCDEVSDKERKQIEAHLAMIFAGALGSARRTDTVRNIRFFSPELAEVDADTVISGTKAADGSEVPPRKGLMVTTMTKQNSRWFISVFHEVEFPPAP